MRHRRAQGWLRRARLALHVAARGGANVRDHERGWLTAPEATTDFPLRDITPRITAGTGSPRTLHGSVGWSSGPEGNGLSSGSNSVFAAVRVSCNARALRHLPWSLPLRRK